ncbi:hypothetical protein D3C77_525450 [compost metagenome]
MVWNEDIGQFEWPEQLTTGSFEECKAIVGQYLSLLTQVKQYAPIEQHQENN